MSLILYNTVYAEPGYVVPGWGSGTDEELATALQKHYAGEIDLNEHWNIGDERPVELTTGETIQMVLMHKGQYPIMGEKVDTPVGNLPVGSVIQLNENGSPVDYIVVHQGNPDPEIYDVSCDGTWVLRKDIYSESGWNDLGNSYGSSTIHSYLNETFWNLFDNDTKNNIKQVKIPYVDGSGDKGNVASGSNGLSCELFLLSGFEVGFTRSDSGYFFPFEGARLAYFTDASKRIAYLNGTAGNWWLRSPMGANSDGAFFVNSIGDDDLSNCGWSYGVRPAFVLNPTFTVKVDPTCAFVVGMKNCLNVTHAMNSASINTGGWNNCEMRTWLNGTVYNWIPESFRSVLKAMNIWTADGGGQFETTGLYSQDYLALPAEKEIFESNNYADGSIELRLFQFDWYRDPANRIKQLNNYSYSWRGRSPAASSAQSFCMVSNLGDAGSSNARNSIGVSFFCAI